MQQDRSSLLYCAYAIAVFDLLCGVLFAAFSLTKCFSHVSSDIEYASGYIIYIFLIAVELACHIRRVLWFVLDNADCSAHLWHLLGKF